MVFIHIHVCINCGVFCLLNYCNSRDKNNKNNNDLRTDDWKNQISKILFLQKFKEFIYKKLLNIDYIYIQYMFF